MGPFPAATYVYNKKNKRFGLNPSQVKHINDKESDGSGQHRSNTCQQDKESLQDSEGQWSTQNIYPGTQAIKWEDRRKLFLAAKATRIYHLCYLLLKECASHHTIKNIKHGVQQMGTLLTQRVISREFREDGEGRSWDDSWELALKSKAALVKLRGSGDKSCRQSHHQEGCCHQGQSSHVKTSPKSMLKFSSQKWP